jgi:tetratricopeptide (TPR) repeat protein
VFPYGLAVFCAALLVRVIYLLESSDNPTFAIPIMDSADYDDLARALLDGHAPRTSLFWQPVFYPLFLTAVYACSGASILAAKLVQVLLGAATCLLTYRLGRRLFNPQAGLIAGLITALYGPLIFFETELLATGWAAFWCVALTLLLLKAADPRNLGIALVLGLCGALSVLTRPTFLPAFIAGCIWWSVTHYRIDRAGRGLVGGLAVIAVGFLLITIPVSVLNQRLHGHFGFMPASGGINVYIGNNPDADATITYRPGRDWNELMALPAQAGVSGDVWEHQRYFYRQARRYALDQPASFLRGLARKCVEFVSSREIPRSVDPRVFRQWSHTLSLLIWRAGGFGFPFGVLLPLALVGLVHHRRKIPGPVWLFLTLCPLAIVLVFVAARYRTPLVPVLAVPAAAGALTFVRAVRNTDWTQLARSGGVVVVVAVATTLPGPFPAERVNYDAELYQFLGNRFLHERKTTEAIGAYQQALQFAPEDPAVHAKLAEALLTEGRVDDAIKHYEASLRVRPDSELTHASLGIALAQKGELEQAVEHYRRAVEIDPTFARAHYNLGAAMQQLGRLDEAIESYRQAARHEPTGAIIRYNLGAALAQRGDLDEAARELRKALEIDPRYSPARALLDRVERSTQPSP